ncbi:MAG TPA: hypothetical protein VEH55_08285 [Gaiellaceae bacterium]|jgi:hypothetical protein|nr:hypothetical protein [Gaiellaceae bacterium]HXY81353.1 hypothetical protein [Gaiellaceae bacterium]
MKRLALAAALMLASASSAVAGLPFYPSGSVVGEGQPLKAYANVTPQVHLFGDAVVARLAVIADTKFVDPARLRVTTSFKPYLAAGGPVVLRLHSGRFAQVTWTWTLRCLTSPCVPRQPPSEKYHVFHFALVHIDYVTKAGRRAYGITASWPPVEVLSQVSPASENALVGDEHISWQSHITPVASPTFRISPTLLFWLALGLGATALLAAAGLGRSWYLTVRPRQVTAPGAVDSKTTLERALALLAWAHERGDETLERKALERVAGELDVEAPLPAADELSRTARELAWSANLPGDEEVETFAEQARESGRHGDDEEFAP